MPGVKVLLLGLRGAGKTLVGPALAARLGLAWIDLDDLTARALGAPTAGAGLSTSGEAAFRRAEADALARVLHTPGSAVVSLGGGTPTAPGAADAIRRALAAGTARTAYLHAPPAALRRRLEADASNRPSLTGAGTLAEIDAVYRTRDGLYRELAGIVVDAEQDAAAVVAALEAWLREPGPG
jgi:shikimate kinase